jgi:phenylalanyl-tRNA synthetase beta subunit
MPAELTDIEKFVQLSESAEECRVKRLEAVVKLKLRTPKTLYTMKLTAEQAAEVLKRVKCEVVET